MTSPDIVCLGEPLVEFNQIDKEGHYLFGHGGDTSNCAIAAARAGASVGYITRLGIDEFGDSFMRLWADNGVDSSHVARAADGHTAVYFVTHGPDGHVFSYLRSGSAASRMTPSDLPRAYIASARVLHVSGISMAISASCSDTVLEAIDVARQAGTLVSFDTNLRLRLWPLERARALTEAAMRHCDIALPGFDDARQLTGLSDPDGIADYYIQLGAGIVALTLGREGCLIATRTERRRIAGIELEAVDATAAGDTFDGNFLADYIVHGNPFRAARFANAAAALSTRGFGAVAPMPMRHDVEAALQRQTSY